MRKSSSSRNDLTQRVRVTFCRGDEVKFITHLDLMRLWQRALRRAGMPLSHSQGFNPHPRISIAAPLAIGVTSDGELMDVFLDRKVSLDFFNTTVSNQLPDGINILGVKELWPGLPSLQSEVRMAEYQVSVESPKQSEEVNQMIRSLKEKSQFPWEHARGENTHSYDLRALVDDIWIVEKELIGYTFGMRLVNDSRGSGRPEQVILAMGFPDPPSLIHRTRLILATG